MASKLYNRGATILNQGLDWETADIRVLLTTSTYVPNVDQNTVSQVTDELTGGNYVREALPSATVTQDDASNRATLDANDVTWTALQAVAGTPQYAVIYYEGGGTDATRELLMFLDLGIPDVPNGGDYTVVWAVAGMANLNT